MNAVAGRRALPLILSIVVALIALVLVAWLAGAFDAWRGRGATARFPGLYVGAVHPCRQPIGQIPAGFDYPNADVPRWLSQGPQGEALARRHGWYLWAGLNYDDGGASPPAWRTWCTSTQAYAGQVPLPGAGRAISRMLSLGARRHAVPGTAQPGEAPIRFRPTPVYTVPPQVLAGLPARCVAPGSPASLNDGPMYESNGDVMVAGVVYNDAAYLSIRRQSLYQPATLLRMLQSGTPPQLDPGSIILKPMMWPVPRSGYSALPVWEPAADQDSYAGFEVQSVWQRAVAVTADPRPAATRTVQLLTNGGATLGGAPLGPNTYPDAPVHSISEFYAFQPDLSNMDACDRAILNASSYWAYNQPFQQGDYLIVVAMHIMTKEQPAWTFQSVWWHDRARAPGPFMTGRPDIPQDLAPGPWRNYLLTSTYGFAGPPGPNGRPQWPIAFNPYIELAAEHPVRTNCINCHHRAAAPAAADPFNPPAWPTGSYEAPATAAAPDPPDALDIFALSDPIFNGVLLVDAVWSISDRVAFTPPQPPGRSARAPPPPPPPAAAAPRRR